MKIEMRKIDDQPVGMLICRNFDGDVITEDTEGLRL